jgi:type VI secretion system protein ImpF
MSLSSSQDYHRLARTMETAIATFEPRLRSIRVKPSATSEAGSRTMRFQIEAVLRLEPVPEQITFDTVLELSSGEYEIKGDPGA